MPANQSGFTLLELIAVMIITAILAVTAYSKLSFSDIDLQSVKSDVLGALVLARETAMARTDGASSVTLVTTTSTVDVRVNGSSISHVYPVNFKNGVTLSSGTGTLTFNSLGETSTHNFVLSKSGANTNITVSGTGYAY